MFFFSSRRRHTRWPRDWSSDVCSSDLRHGPSVPAGAGGDGVPGGLAHRGPRRADQLDPDRAHVMRGARMRQRRTLDRRTLLSGTVAAAGAATVAGCGQIFAEAEIKEPDPSHTRFVMTVWGGEPDREAYQARVDLAQEQFPEYEIVLQLIPDANYAQKVQTMISSDTGPDIMQVAEDINVYSSRAQLVPLDEMIAEAGIDMERTFGA